MKTVFKSLISLISIFAIYGTLHLAFKEWQIGGICPSLFGIPACYIVLLCFLVVLISHLLDFRYSKWFYFIFLGIVTIIATTGTLGELLGSTKCPRTSSGIPMCFISLAICLSLLFSKFYLVRINTQH